MEYLESEVIRLLKKQRKLCAKEVTFMPESQLEEMKKRIIHAPMPDLKK